jgi:LAO/AO transport system kinase
MTDTSSNSETNRREPEWAPAEKNEAFASKVVKGVRAGSHDASKSQAGEEPRSGSIRRRRRTLSVAEHIAGVLDRDRVILARTITLIESNAIAHQEKAQEVLRQLLPHTGDSIRIGVTGVPGVGKSTFIEAFGMHLLDQKHRVAVLTIDPTSKLTRGSILGDKTRMEQLSRQEDAFIRPSPTGGVLGGVARKTRETILVCEAAGFDVVLLETVGVGQSETVVRSMVDFFLLLMLAGAGDELQGIKKGIMELADMLVITKADGDNLPNATRARADYNRALHYLAPATEGWRTRAFTCSALTGEGIPQVWQVIQRFQRQTLASGVFDARRKTQAVDWMQTMIEEHLRSQFFADPAVQAALPGVKAAVEDGSKTATRAAQELLELYNANLIQISTEGK